MKLTLRNRLKLLSSVAIAAGVFSGITTSASAQTLGSAANFDILVLNGGKIELKDGNQLFGDVGYSNGVDATKNSNVQDFVGGLYVHSGAKFKPGNINPSDGIFTSGFDSILNQANVDVANYASYLSGLSSDLSFSGTYKDHLSFFSTGAISVIDFNKVDTTGKDFTFTGRLGETDQIVIRISDEFKFKGGNINLVNLEASDVIWYLSSDKKFDLHKGFSNFQGTIVAPDGEIVLGETIFTGQAYGQEMKLGSGFAFQVPEPSSSLMVLLGAGGLFLRRRR